MNRFGNTLHTRRARALAAMVAGLAGFATAALVGVALARTFTLHVANNANVTNQSGTTKRENIVVTLRGFAVYALSGDSRAHPECTEANGCFAFWPPVKVSSPRSRSKAPGIRGKLGVWHHDGFFQLTLGGHPLYRYAADSRKDDATGEGVQSFGGTWHVRTPQSSGGGTTTMPSGTTTTTTTPTTTTSCQYPPCY